MKDLLKNVFHFSEWVYNKPLQGVVFILSTCCILLLYSNKKKSDQYENVLSKLIECNQEKSENEERITKLLFNLIPQQKRVNDTIFQTTTVIDSTLKKTKNTLQEVKKRF